MAAISHRPQKRHPICGCLFLFERLLLVHAAGNAQAGQNSSQNSYYRLNNKFPSFFFHFVQFLSL